MLDKIKKIYADFLTSDTYSVMDDTHKNTLEAAYEFACSDHFHKGIAPMCADSYEQLGRSLSNGSDEPYELQKTAFFVAGMESAAYEYLFHRQGLFTAMYKSKVIEKQGELKKAYEENLSNLASPSSEKWKAADAVDSL